MTAQSQGLCYMAFGKKAGAAVRRSVFSLQRLGTSYPVTVIGDCQVSGTSYLEWVGSSPFDKNKKTNFKFRAGRVKPFIYQCSPYDWTMYLDADTVFMQPIEEGFSLLKDYDLIVTEEILSLAELYNAKLSGWEINIQERDLTVIETGGDDSQKFINSGVMLFRRNKNVEKLFQDWYLEWFRFQEWDEQLALTRAIYKNPAVKVHHLGVKWNAPHLYEKDIVIYHAYGRGDVRENTI